jgi:hypothetical protein
MYECYWKFCFISNEFLHGRNASHHLTRGAPQTQASSTLWLDQKWNDYGLVWTFCFCGKTVFLISSVTHFGWTLWPHLRPASYCQSLWMSRCPYLPPHSTHKLQPLDKKFMAPLRHYLLTPWCRVLLEKLTGLQLVEKFLAFYGTRRFITALTSVLHLSLSWASPIQSTYPHPASWRSSLILSTHLRQGLPSGLFPSGFTTKTLYTPSPHPYAPHAQPISLNNYI